MTPVGGGVATRSLEKRTDFDFDLSGNLTSRVVAVATAAGGSETITESWTYDQDWPATHTIFSDARSNDKFRETFTFERAGLAPGEPGYSATALITNVHSISRLHFDDTPETTTFDYDGNGRLAAMTLPDTHALVLPRYAATDNSGGVIRNGLVRRRAHVDGGVEDAHLKTLYDYDAAGRIASLTDARSLETTYTWDALGRLKQIENPLGEQTLFTYGSPDGSAEGWQLVQTETGHTAAGGEGRITKLVYDSLGQLTQIQRKTGTGTAGFAPFASYTNDTAGRRLTATDARSHTTTFGWDLLGRRTSITDAAVPPNTTLFAYDAVGNRTKQTDALLRETDFVYDALDRLIESEALGPNPVEITQFAYDAAGNVMRVTDPKNQATAYGYDGFSRLTSVTQALGIATPGDPNDFSVRYAYDDRGRLETVTNARGQVLHSFYFAWGGLEKMVYDLDGNGVEPGEREVSYTYDLNGNVESASDTLLSGAVPPTGQLYTFSYDERNRVKDATAHFIGGEPLLRSAYDRFGDRDALAVNPAGENLLQQWNFDALGRLAVACMPQNQQVPAVPCVPGGSTETLAMSHFANDDLDTLTHGNGLVTAFAYYPEGPIESISVGGAPLHRLAYTVDDVLNVETITETIEGVVKSPVYDYGYDAVNRLTSATYPSGLGLPSGSPGETFGYDAAGNRDDDPAAATPWNYDANNRLVASPGSALSCYDDDGNLTSRRSTGDCISGTVTETFTWDATNRLVGYVNAVTGATATYAYDPFGRRIRKVADPDGAGALPTATTWYLWDGDQLLAEYDGSGTRALRYAYAGGFAPAQVAYRTGPGTEAIYDVHSDHLDTPKVLTNASGAIAWRAAHEAFGKAALDGGNDVTFNLRFPGQYFDAESGLHDNRFRTYDPAIGRYISADPVGQAGGINVFGYSKNNPSSMGDPYGLDTINPDRDNLVRQVSRWWNSITDFASRPFEKTTEEVIDVLPQAVGDEYGDAANKALEAARAADAAKRIADMCEIAEERASHIFRNDEGHLPDTPENRALLRDVANDPAATRGVDQWGNTWSARGRDDGTQVWTQTRDNKIVNGGVNSTPREFNSESGLSGSGSGRTR